MSIGLYVDPFLNAYRERSRVVPKMPSAFAQWLKENRERRGLSKKALAEKIGANSHVHVTDLENDKANPSRQKVLDIAAAMELGREATNRGLLAAGFAPIIEEGEIIRIIDTDDAEMIDAYEGLPESLQESNRENILRQAAAMRQRTRSTRDVFGEERSDEGINPPRTDTQ